MKSLLDVNALVSWAHASAPHHAAIHAWRQANAGATVCSCAITELGFLRVSMAAFGYDAAQAARELYKLRTDLEYLSDLPSPDLPDWCQTHRQTTDAYLVQLAEHHGAQLLTFDAGIPGAARIPFN